MPENGEINLAVLSPNSIGKLTVPILRVLLEKHGLDTSGKKADLEARVKLLAAKLRTDGDDGRGQATPPRNVTDKELFLSPKSTRKEPAAKKSLEPMLLDDGGDCSTDQDFAQVELMQLRLAMAEKDKIIQLQQKQIDLLLNLVVPELKEDVANQLKQQSVSKQSRSQFTSRPHTEQKQKRTICKYFGHGKCNKGKACTYVHPCKFYAANKCKSQNCKFDHPNLCKHGSLRQCPNKHKCNFVHTTKQELSPKQQPARSPNTNHPRRFPLNNHRRPVSNERGISPLYLMYPSQNAAPSFFSGNGQVVQPSPVLPPNWSMASHWPSLGVPAAPTPVVPTSSNNLGNFQHFSAIYPR
jgi:hypothetical protein